MKKLLCYFLIYSLIFTNSCTSLLSLVSRTEHEEITTFRKVFEEHNKVNVETSGNTIKITATRVLNFKDDKVTRPKGSIGGGDDWIYFVALLRQGLLSLIFTSKVFPAQPNNPKLGWKEDKNFWPQSLDHALWNGGYPRIYTQQQNPAQWYADYIATYLERDIRQIKNILEINSVFLK